MVPKKFRESVMELGHRSVLSAHLGKQATGDKICSNFFWPGIFSDIVRYTRSCDICQKSTPAGKHMKVPLGKVPIMDVPFKFVSVDIIGPLTLSDKGNQYILTLIDSATRYPEAICLKKIDTCSVAEGLMSIFSRVGFPEEIQSDQGSQFTSGMMKELCRLISIHQIINTPYHAMANYGAIERMNGTLKTMIKKLCAENDRQWDRYVDPALFAYRSCVHSSTGFSPFELLYGRTVRGPLDILKKLWTSEESENAETRTTYQYIYDLVKRLTEACEIAAKSLKCAHEVNKTYFVKKTKNQQFKVGDKVLLLSSESQNKLRIFWKGPFTVT